MAILFLAAFFWASSTGPHDDVHTPGMRILFEDEPPEKSEEDHFSN
jgi:cbb3-type cytochrome oxidase maturation protein